MPDVEHEPLSPHRRAELRDAIARMRTSADVFYTQAALIGVHPFIEFAGLMNEYIKLCEAALEKGIDFSQANAHTGIALPAQPYHIAYLYEKLDCIYGPTVAMQMRQRLERE